MVGARGKWQDPMGVAEFAHVVKSLRDLFPQVGDIGEPAFYWSGRVAITPDYLPHVHEPEPGLAILLGFNGRGVAMALNTVVAVSVGGTVPLVLRRFKMDPALASGPILTTVTDMSGFFLVLSIATAAMPLLTAV